jgi:MFS family permease
LALGAPVPRALIGSLAALSFSRGLIGALILVYVARELALPPAVIGALFGVGGVSSLLGALLAGRVARRWGVAGALIGGLVISGTAALLIPLARGPLGWTLLCLVGSQVLGDGAATVYEINQVSLLQEAVPERALGRVNASARTVEGAAALGGLLLGGALGGALGLRPTLTLGALGWALASLWLVYSPVRDLRGEGESLRAG